MAVCILLVEDEALIREVMTESLEDAGFEVMPARNGAEATAALRDATREFSVVITDLHMPGDIDGLRVAVEARSINPSIPVILASGRTDVLGAALLPHPKLEVLSKPYLPSTLVARVRALLTP